MAGHMLLTCSVDRKKAGTNVVTELVIPLLRIGRSRRCARSTVTLVRASVVLGASAPGWTVPERHDCSHTNGTSLAKLTDLLVSPPLSSSTSSRGVSVHPLFHKTRKQCHGRAKQHAQRCNSCRCRRRERTVSAGDETRLLPCFDLVSSDLRVAAISWDLWE